MFAALYLPLMFLSLLRYMYREREQTRHLHWLCVRTKDNLVTDSRAHTHTAVQSSVACISVHIRGHVIS